MLRANKILMMCLLICTGLFAQVSLGTSRILASVEGEPITSYDVNQRVKLLELYHQYKQETMPPDVQNTVLDELVKESVKMRALRSKMRSVHVTQQQLNESMSSLAQEMGLSMETFRIVMKTHDISPKTVKQFLIVKVLWQDLVFALFSEKLMPNKKQRAKLMSQQVGIPMQEVDMGLIWLPYNHPAIEDMATVRNYIDENLTVDNFESMARTYSQDSSNMQAGRVGWLAVHTLVQTSLMVATEQLGPGTISGALEGTDGIYFVKIYDKRTMPPPVSIKWILDPSTTSSCNAYEEAAADQAGTSDDAYSNVLPNVSVADVYNIVENDLYDILLLEPGEMGQMSDGRSYLLCESLYDPSVEKEVSMLFASDRVQRYSNILYKQFLSETVIE